MQRHLSFTLRTVRQPTLFARSLRFTSSNTKPESSAQDSQSTQTDQGTPKVEEAAKPRTLTIAEQDEALRAKMSGLSGEGGEAGVEYENGEPVAMKRSVKNNMFRYI